MVPSVSGSQRQGRTSKNNQQTSKNDDDDDDDDGTTSTTTTIPIDSGCACARSAVESAHPASLWQQEHGRVSVRHYPLA